MARARPALARHYQRTFGYPKAKADTLARLAIAIYLDRAAGSFPRGSVPWTERVLGIARHVKEPLDKLKSALNDADVNHRYRRDAEQDDCAYNIVRTRTPLMHAAQHADVAMLRLLLQKGASLHDVDGLGDNATDYALRSLRDGNTGYLKSLGLVSPRGDKARAQRTRVDACLAKAKAKKLTGRALSQFFTSCYDTAKPE